MKKSCLLGYRAGSLTEQGIAWLIIVSYVGLTLKRYKTDRKRQKLTGDSYRWQRIFEDYLGRECNHITNIFEKERKT